VGIEYEEPDLAPTLPNQQLWETHRKDGKALFLIQLAVDDEIFPRITEVATSHEA